MNKFDKIIRILQSHHLRITQSRIAAIKILIENTYVSLLLNEIFNKIQCLRNLNRNQIPVYRTLLLFQKLGLVRKSIFQAGATRYVLCCIEKGIAYNYKHYFRYLHCNVIEAFKDCFFTKKELKENGYRNLSYTRLCAECTHNWFPIRLAKKWKE